MFSGSLVALVTPMHTTGEIDADAYARLIEWQIAQGTHGLVTVGSTGEGSTLTHREHQRCIEIAVATAAGRVPVIAGTGSNSTTEAIELTKFARQAGVAAALVVVPYYNKPTQDGLVLHYSAIANAVDLPILIYNIPPRSVIDMSVATMARLARHSNIIGVKDSTSNLSRPVQTRRACGPAFCQLSGEDGTAIAFNAAGGTGCISVTANVAPALCAAMQNAWKAGRVTDAMALQDRLMPLHDALFIESNPGPVKHAASLLGFGTAFCRLPLAPLMPASAAVVSAAMQDLELVP